MGEGLECPKCKGEMKAGVICDNSWSSSGDHGWRLPEDKSFLDGLFGAAFGLVVITSYRCDKCGFLENYAKG